jgi:hypothetical protein
VSSSRVNPVTASTSRGRCSWTTAAIPSVWQVLAPGADEEAADMEVEVHRNVVGEALVLPPTSPSGCVGMTLISPK